MSVAEGGVCRGGSLMNGESGGGCPPSLLALIDAVEEKEHTILGSIPAEDGGGPLPPPSEEPDSPPPPPPQPPLPSAPELVVVDLPPVPAPPHTRKKPEPESNAIVVERLRPTAWVNPLPVEKKLGGGAVGGGVAVAAAGGGAAAVGAKDEEPLDRADQGESILHKLLQTNSQCPQVEGAAGEVIDRLKRLGTVVEVEPPAHLLEPLVDIAEDLGPDGTFAFRNDYFAALPLLPGQRCYTCDICSAVYQQPTLLRKHYLKLHVSRKYISERDIEQYSITREEDCSEEGTRLVWRCHVCIQRFPGKAELRLHLTDHPPTERGGEDTPVPPPPPPTPREYECARCSARFKWRKPYLRHKKNCKPPPASPGNRPSLYHCLYCDETFASANRKKNHVLSSHPYCRRRQPCSLCSAPPFPSHPALFAHLLDNHSDIYHACRLCKERFLCAEELQRHDEGAHGGEGNHLTNGTDGASTPPVVHTCPDCRRMFLLERALAEHVCVPPRSPQSGGGGGGGCSGGGVGGGSRHRHDDPDTLFYSRVSTNIRDNLLNHLDGKLDVKSQAHDSDAHANSTDPPGGAKILNFSASFCAGTGEVGASTGSGGCINSGEDSATSLALRGSKTPWEKYSFPPTYDGRCGLTSYIRDTSYLDLSTQLIMRRNLQRLMPPAAQPQPDDVPSVLALERLGAQCAESFGQPAGSQSPQPENGESGERVEMTGELSGEWVRERTYICSVCSWETPCLWAMEDHKYEVHPHVHCPQHELVGEARPLSKLIYTRLLTVDAPFGPTKPVWEGLPPVSEATCTKCGAKGFSGGAAELHRHIVECAGAMCGAVGTPRKRRRTRLRRMRRGLRRNIPSTPQPSSHRTKPPRTKPGDSDTIQKMIANLPAKRATRRAIGFDDVDIKTRSQATIQNIPNVPRPVRKSKGKPQTEKGEEREKPEKKEGREGEEEMETWAERGDVMSGLRMVRVGGKKGKPSGMPTLEIERDLAPVHSPEIPVLSPAPPQPPQLENFICGISFVDGVIKYETLSSVTEELRGGGKRRRRKEEKRRKAVAVGRRKVLTRSVAEAVRRGRSRGHEQQLPPPAAASPKKRKSAPPPPPPQTPEEKPKKQKETPPPPPTPEEKPKKEKQTQKTPPQPSKKRKASKTPDPKAKKKKFAGPDSIVAAIEEVVRESHRLAALEEAAAEVSSTTKPEEVKEEKAAAEEAPEQAPEQKEAADSMEVAQEGEPQPAPSETPPTPPPPVPSPPPPPPPPQEVSPQDSPPQLEKVEDIVEVKKEPTEEEQSEEPPKVDEEEKVETTTKEAEGEEEEVTVKVEGEAVEEEKNKEEKTEDKVEEEEEKKEEEQQEVKEAEAEEVVEDKVEEDPVEEVAEQEQESTKVKKTEDSVRVKKKLKSKKSSKLEICMKKKKKKLKSRSAVESDTSSSDTESEDSYRRSRRTVKGARMARLGKRKRKKCRRGTASAPNGGSGEVIRVGGFKWEVSSLEAEAAVSSTTVAEEVAAPAVQPREEYPAAEQAQAQPAPAAALWQPQDNTSLGTILDSVNKLLNEPDTTYSPLGLPQYSLADLQRAMGASDAEMAVLQQLGEASLQEDGVKEEEDWSETCIMDLDNQQGSGGTPVQQTAQGVQRGSTPVGTAALTQQPPPASSPAPTSTVHQTLAQPALQQTGHGGNLLHHNNHHHQSQGGDSLLLEHSAKEVVCPSCSGHFLGFPALHSHITNAHSDLPNSPGNAGQGKARRGSLVHKQDLLGLKRSGKESRLVCCQCRRILSSGAMANHLVADHGLPLTAIANCTPADTEEGGERLKSKMSSALGDLLDRAVNNLIAAKRSGSPHQLSCGAVQLLTKLCAVRRKDTLHRTRTKEENDEGAEKNSQWPYPCPVCQQRFTLASARNQHMVAAHTKPRATETNEVLEYENDWREAPSPTFEDNEANGEAEPRKPVEPLCLDCGLGFKSLSELTAHRLDYHATRNQTPSPSGAGAKGATVTAGANPSVGGPGVRKRKDDQGGQPKKAPRRNSLKKVRLTHIGEESVREKAEAALRELNLPRKGKEGSARWARSMTFTREPPLRVAASGEQPASSDTYTFTDTP